VIVYETPAAQALTITYLTLFGFSQWMNSCRSLDNGCIWVLGHDQFKQQLQFFISGQRAVVLVVGNMKKIYRPPSQHLPSRVT
jgi:hypothetical protein